MITLQTEQQFVDAVLELAQLRGWLCHHDRPARTDKGWRTAVQGTAGFPDLVLAREGEVHYWEAKRTERERPTALQVAWLNAVPDGRVIVPGDWDWIEEALR